MSTSDAGPRAPRRYDTTLRDGTRREGLSLSVDHEVRTVDTHPGTASRVPKSAAA